MQKSKQKNLTRLLIFSSFGIGLIFGLVFFILMLMSASTAVAQNETMVGNATEPTNATVPANFTSSLSVRTIPYPMNISEPEKSIVVNLNFNNRNEVQFESASVVPGRAHTHIGDPPQLFIEFLDYNGGGMEEKGFNTWNPLFDFEYNSRDDTEVIEVRQNVSAIFVVPFEPNLGFIRINDLQSNQELATIDLRPAINEFCRNNVNDPDCRISDLVISQLNLPPSPQMIALGSPIDVIISTTIANRGPEGPINAMISGETVEAPPGLMVTPPPVIQFEENNIGLNEERQLDFQYHLECLEPGEYDVIFTFTSRILPSSAIMIDPFEASNLVQKGFIVSCLESENPIS